MNKNQTYELVVIAIFSALIFIMANVPWLGYITIGIISLTTVHIPVLIGGIFGGRKVSIALGLVFGLSSLYVALVRPVTPVDLLFQNPLVSVLPRVLFGWALYEIYRGLRSIINSEILAISISMGIATFVHTVLVLTALFLVGGGVEIFGPLMDLIWVVLGSNGVWEIIAAIVIGGPIAERLLVYRKSSGN